MGCRKKTVSVSNENNTRKGSEHGASMTLSGRNGSRNGFTHLGGAKRAPRGVRAPLVELAINKTYTVELYALPIHRRSTTPAPLGHWDDMQRPTTKVCRVQRRRDGGRVRLGANGHRKNRGGRQGCGAGGRQRVRTVRQTGRQTETGRQKETGRRRHWPQPLTGGGRELWGQTVGTVGGDRWWRTATGKVRRTALWAQVAARAGASRWARGGLDTACTGTAAAPRRCRVRADIPRCLSSSGRALWPREATLWQSAARLSHPRP